MSEFSPEMPFTGGDAAELKQDLGLYADKTYTTEELFRLRSHAVEMEDWNTFDSLQNIVAIDAKPEITE